MAIFRARYFFLLSAFLLVLAASPALGGSEISGRVVKVADGDTLTILAPGNRQVKVRLYGIDCPERKQAFGQAARKFATERAAGRQASAEIMDTDRYGRKVGVVRVEGLNLNEELLSAGLAWVYDRYCKASFCREWKRKEGEARRARRGLWADKSPMPPWEWRKERRRR